jgi:hypothetical protein
MAVKLPFDVEPKAQPIQERVGNEDIGILKLPRINDLSPADRLFIRNTSKTMPNIQREAVKMAKAIAASAGMKLVEAYEALVGGDTEVLGEYLEEILAFQDLVEEVSAQRPQIMATAMLRRVVPDWTLEQTQTLSSGLIQSLAEFANKEEHGWEVATEAAEPVSEETLKK